MAIKVTQGANMDEPVEMANYNTIVPRLICQ